MFLITPSKPTSGPLILKKRSAVTKAGSLNQFRAVISFPLISVKVKSFTIVVLFTGLTVCHSKSFVTPKGVP